METKIGLLESFCEKNSAISRLLTFNPSELKKVSEFRKEEVYVELFQDERYEDYIVCIRNSAGQESVFHCNSFREAFDFIEKESNCSAGDSEFLSMSA